MDLFLWTKLLVASEWLVRLLLLPVIVLRKEKPATCLAWLVIVFFEPWIGLGLYLLIGESRLGRRRLARRRRRHEEFASSEHPALNAQHVVDPARHAEHELLVHLDDEGETLPVVGGNSVVFFADPDVVINRLIADIDAAQGHAHLLFYIMRDDVVGRRVGEALVRARRRGVACRVMADHAGSWRMFRRLATELRRQGVEVVPVLPVSPWRLPFARLDLRNHRKLAVIDGTIAYTGSQNIVEPTYGHKKAGAWHDIMARITGPVVRQLQGIFLEDWFHETGQLLEDAALTPVCSPTGEVTIQVVPSGPDLPTNEFQDLIVRAIFMAQERVVITSPYFIPSEGMLLALRLAAKRGVEVKLVVPRRSDHRLVDAAGRFYLEYLAEHGVKVYLYEAGILHAKILTIDDRLAMFGSANYDIRSFDLNFELNLLLHAKVAVADLYTLQQNYLARSRLAADEDWPSRTFLGRLKVNIAKLFSPLL